MKKILSLAIISVLVLFTSCFSELTAPNQKSVLKNFITAESDKLMDGDTEFRFVSYNIPGLHYNEDNMAFDETNPWRFPDFFEIADALGAVKQSGGQVARCYTLSVKKADDAENIPRHVLAPGSFNEDAFRALDRVLKVANEKGIRVIIPFVDNWSWWGGAAEYAIFRDKKAEQFWTDEQVIADFEKTINYVINRTNHYTGVKYKEDMAILAWETGNELKAPAAWTRRITAYIKSLDSNHLVIDGFNTNVVITESIDNPNADIVTSHHYEPSAEEMIEHILTSRKLAKGKKPYFVGEFGFIPTDGMRKVLDTVIDSGTSGALIWSLRYRSRDGGFYWHSEPMGGNKFKAYHWPGFPSGAEYDETILVKLMQQKAFQIRGLDVPEIQPPSAPKLLPIESPSAINWQGSVGAAGYNIERSKKRTGPWKTIAENITDAWVQYRPLFNDDTARLGDKYYYRVKAVNPAGASEPSNIEGPVTVKHLALIDEMLNAEKIHRTEGQISFPVRDTRKMKEDMHRLRAESGAAIIYKLPLSVHSWKVYSFFPQGVSDFKFYYSADGENFTAAEAQLKSFYTGPGGYEKVAYGYWIPALYESAAPAKNSRYLKIEFTAEAQISRIEIYYGQ